MPAHSDRAHRNAKLIDSGELVLPAVEAGHTVTVKWGPSLPAVTPQSQRWALFSFRLRKGCSWSLPEQEVAWAEFAISEPPQVPTPSSSLSASSMRINTSQRNLTLSSWDSHVVFDKTRGLLTEWTAEEQPMLAKNLPLRLTTWRAPTDNDAPKDAPYWRRFGVDTMCEDIRSVSSGWISGPDAPESVYGVTFDTWLSTPVLSWGFRTTTSYRSYGSGGLEVRVRAVPEGPSPRTLPRFGLEMGLPTATSRVRYCGLGPGESYRDKQAAARTGVWVHSVDDLVTSYEVPQENGNRTRTRWAELTAESGAGLRVWMEKRKPEPSPGKEGLFDFAVQRHSADQLEKAGHPHELPPSRDVILRVDVGHHGLGTGSCGPGVLPQHELTTKEFEFSVFLQRV